MINIDTNYRKAEAMLYNYKKIQIEIDNAKLKIKEIENTNDEISAISYNEKGTPTNAFSSTVENAVMRKEKLIEQIERNIKSKEIKLQKIENAIDSLEQRQKSIVYMRYFDKKTNRYIANKLNVSEVHVCRLKNKIIKDLTPLMIN